LARPFSTLPKYIESIQEGMAPALVEVHKSIATAGLEQVVEATPVDTSLAVSNWLVSLTGPVKSIAPARATSVKGSGASVARGATIQLGKSKISALKFGQTVFISNNVPYIGLLESGSPKHRANNMTSKAMQSMSVRAKQVKLEIKPKR
jgi:hypothetical protein